MIRYEYKTAAKLFKLFLFITFICHAVTEDVEVETNAKVEETDTRAHELAQVDDVDELIDLISDDNRHLLFAEDENKWTPLHESARQGNVISMSFLIENGADPLAKNIDGKIPRELLFDPVVLEEQREEETDDINDKYKLSEVILDYAEKGQALDGYEIDREELNETDDVVVDFHNLANALVHFGLRWTLQDLYMLDDSVLEDSDENGWTPLHEAMRTGNIDIISYLIRQGADMYARTNDEHTPLDIGLHFAEELGSTTHIDLLRLEMERAPEEL